MNQDFVRSTTLRRTIWLVVALIFIGLVLYAFVHGTITVTPPAGYKVSYYDLNQHISKPQPISNGFHILGTGEYQVSFVKGSKQYTKTITVQRFLQHQTVSFEEAATKPIEHISTGTRHYTYPLEEGLISYDKLGAYVLQQQLNDPIGAKNRVIDYMEGDGECRVMGILQSTPWCLSKGIDYSNELALYPINIAAGQPDGTRRMEMSSNIFALDNNRLITIQGLEAKLYQDIQATPNIITLKKSVARNGDSAIVSTTGKLLAALAGDNFDDSVGDSPQSTTAQKSYDLYFYDTSNNSTRNTTIRNIAPVEKISLSPDGKYTALHTTTGITIIDSVSGKTVFAITNNDINDGAWYGGSYLFQDVNGIYSCDADKRSSYPIVTHERITISSFNIINDFLYFTGYYRSQAGQDPQGFRVNLKTAATDTNELYNFLPTEQSNFAVYIDQKTLYVLNREVVGKVGAQSSSKSDDGLKFIKEKLPEPYKSYQVINLN